jgi:hypothetical protein
MKRAISIVFIFIFLVSIINLVYASTESDFLSSINNERTSLNKPLVYTNYNLTQAAYLHSKEMAENNYFSHNSLDNSSFDKRIIAVGYTGFKSLGENIAYASGPEDANRLFDMWKNSPGHYSNMISDLFNEIGLGIYSANGLTYYTLDMGKRLNFMPQTNESLIPSNLSNNISNISNSSANNLSNSSAQNTSNNNLSSNSSSSSNASLQTPVKNSTTLFLSLEKTESTNSYYKFIKLTGTLNEKSKVYYVLEGKSYNICTKCNKFNIYIRTKINNTNLTITAISPNGNKDIKVYS